MKLDDKARRGRETREFSGSVEVAVTGIDKQHRRMTTGYRRSFRVNETTVEEVFDVVYKAIEEVSDE